MSWDLEEKLKWSHQGVTMGCVVSLFDSFGMHKAYNDHDLVRLHFGLRGDYRFSYKQLNKTFDLAGGHHNIMYSKGIDLEIYNKTLEIETFGITFPTDYFLQFIDDSDEFLNRFATGILNGKNIILSNRWGSINSAIQNVIDEILLNPYSGALKNIFMAAKSLELLVLCIDNYRQLSNKPFFHVKSTKDKEKIIAARDYINMHFVNPPNLSDIAKYVGINEYKLKHGFKELFQNTVFGYIKLKRLNYAKHLLLNTNQTAAEISFQLGYSSPQHFNSQFQHHFGKTPISIRKNP